MPILSHRRSLDRAFNGSDVDNAIHPNGAEDEYYQGLPVPYKTKNGMMETVEELLLIRGVTPEYYYGRTERAPDGSPTYLYGLSRYTTVFSAGRGINVNFAPLQVLMAIPGMPPEAAEAIYQRRQVKPFASIDEINRELPVSLGPTVLPALNIEHTGVYTLTASGRREGARTRRVIRAVVRLDAGDPKRHRILYWNENVPNL